jgi:2-polyprenyl-6-methoxyphenol hydroxylase-like FAD-dependent oxidoreductase
VRIAIVGGEISGLSTYLFLKKLLLSSGQPQEITIYEKHLIQKAEDDGPISAPVVGSGLGIGANGLNVLHDLDGDLHDAIALQGYPATRHQMKTSSNMTLGNIKCFSDKEGFEPTVIISRQELWNCHHERVPESAIISGKAVDHVKK